MISVRINAADMARLTSAIAAVKNTVVTAEKNLPYAGATDYRNSIYTAISEQAFPMSYEPLSPSYVAWKQRVGGYDGFWRLFGNLIASLRVAKTQDGWASGVPPGETNARGDNIAEYAERNEERRALFLPLAEQYSDNGWKQRWEEALRAIESAWK